MIIGICGKSGCGKSTLARQMVELTNHKAIHLDIDKIGHDVLLIDEVKEKLVKSFGNSILKESKIDRKKLGVIVFDSRNEMKKLSDITWQYMQIEIDKFINNNKDKIVILDWALLSITKYFAICDLTVFLDVPYAVRKQRAMRRDNISETAFDLREKASLNYNPEDFDYVLKNNEEETVKGLVKLL